MKWKIVVLIALIGIMCFPFLSGAVEMKLTSSTQYLWFNDIIAEDDVDAVAQYLRLTTSKLDAADNVTITGYGRATKQFSTGEDVEGRLYYLFLGYKDLIQDVLDVKLGRQFIYIPSGSGLIDGATLDFKKLGPVGVKLLAGRDVRFIAERNEVTSGKDRMIGASLYSDAIRLTHLETSYTRRYDTGDTSRETVGFSASTYLPKQVSLYADGKYDVLSAATSEVLAGARFSPVEKLSLKAEYYQSFPTFDATSIYSVFAVNQYVEMLVNAEYQLNDQYRVALGYANENFNDDEHADLYTIGLMARPTEQSTLNASYDVRKGFSGKLGGLRLNGTYAMGKAVISAGADFADYRRDSMTESATAKKYWAGGEYNFTQMVALVARVENNVNVNYSHNYQGVASLNMNF